MNKPIHSPERTAKRRKKNGLKLRFGINFDQYEYMLQEQNSVCAICGNKDKKDKDLAVDHCHTTDKVRGLLCSDCNLGLGQFKDSVDLLLRAKKYLERDYKLPEIEDTLGYIDRDDRPSWKMLVITPDGKFPSLQHAANFYNVNFTTVRAWCHENSKYKKDGYSCTKMFISLNKMKESIDNVWN